MSRVARMERSGPTAERLRELAHGYRNERRGDTLAAWDTALGEADAAEIAKAISGISAGGFEGEMILPLRDAARATIDVKLTERVVAETRRLERVGLFLGGVGLMLAVVQIVLEMR